MGRESEQRDHRRGIALVGYRATGKSTVGRIVADRLGWAFEDADDALEGRIGQSIASLFAEHGEGTFRDLEEATLAELTTRSRLVLASGGGAVLREANRTALQRFGFVAWLSARPETLVDRLRRDPANRPALTSAGLLDEVATMLRQREDLYRSVADERIEVDERSAEQVAEAVLAAWSRIAPDNTSLIDSQDPTP
ncbi:shikimate kinase [Tautonia rosea]|uniref:shikimate kinase n=1 Tax=Tautonia rosea TaxID=2728037 RepID=UPI001473070A|nr:shikimate kinase [Tautonia rosea]